MKDLFSNTSEVEVLKTPVPAKTDTYSPVAHRDVISEIEEQLDKRNLNIVSKAYKGASGNNRLIGYFDINNGDPDMGFRFGFKNSYDKSMSLGMVAGSQIWICSNGMMSGDIQFVRKHTGTILSEMRSKIITTIDQLEEVFFEHSQDKILMDKIQLSDEDRALLLGELFFNKGLISPHQSTVIKEELSEDAEYPEFDNNNLWGVYNKITHSYKKSHPNTQIEDHINLHNYVKASYL